MRKSIACLVLLSLVVTACGPKSLPPLVDGGKVNEEQKRQQEIIIKDYTDRVARVDRVAHKILAANAELCADEVSYAPGLTVMAKSDVYRPYRDAAAYFLTLDHRPKVLAVVPGGPADAAGVQVGDVVAAVNGKPCDDAGQVAKAAKEGKPVALTLDRTGTPVQATITPAKVCNYPVQVMDTPEVNAMAFGDRILVFSGMAKFCRTDDELATIIGHELAHCSMEHMKAKRGNSILMSLLIDGPIIALTGANPQIGANIGAGINSQGFEAEADYVGLYHSARAGYDIQDAAAIWRRMATENPQAITHATSHPTTASRFVALEAARDEINAKRAGGKELRPEMKVE